MGRVNVRQKDKSINSKTEEEIYNHAFLTIDEVASLLRVSKRTVYNLIYMGKLRACKISYHVTIIKKEDFQIMLTENTYIKQEKSFFAKKVKDDKKVECVSCVSSEYKPIPLSSNTLNKGKKESLKVKVKKTEPLKTVTDYQQSVRRNFVDSCEEKIYTMSEVCSKFKYTYGRFYNLRMKYQIPCIKGQKTKCFPKHLVDMAMEEESISLGNGLSEHWYSCFDIMRIYGLGKTQVRRFAQKYNVRIKTIHNGRRNLYLKADWEAARTKSQAISYTTKSKRDV